MIKRLYTLVLVVIASLFFSCEEETDINIDNYVINSFFSEDTPFVIQATRTVSVFDTATYSTIKDMEGELYEEGELVGDFTFQESYMRAGLAGEVPEGYTVTGFVPQQGKEYSFELRHDDFVIKGSDVIPNVVNFTVADTNTVYDDYEPSIVGLECMINFKDPEDKTNYYIIAYNHTDFYVTNDELGWTQATGWMKSDDPAIEHSYYHQGLLYTAYRFIFSDKYFNGQDYTIPVSFFVGHNSGNRMNLNIFLISISEQYYMYVTSVIKQQENNNDYYAEPTQVYNNIQNGFGIFGGFSGSKYVMEFGKE